ncbi:hypothetical protein KCU90_g3956, partial [Aureobasidium melanogenum]
MTDDRSGQILGVAIAFLIPTAISTALRVYTRTKVLRSQAGRDDVAMVLAFALYLIYLVCQLSGVAHGSGKKRYLIDDHTAQKGLMYWFFCEISYTLATATLKISIGLFLLRIAVDRTHIWIIRWIMIFNVLFGVPYCLLVTFQCKPVSFWWDLDPNHHGKCISPKVIVINTKLQMKRQTKIMVASILGFAALGSTATIVRTPFVHTLADFKGEFLYNNADVAIWTTVELGIGCTAANAATLRPLLSRFRAHFGVPSTQTGSRHLGGTISRGGGKRSKRSDLDDQTLVTLDELRAGGQDGGKTEVVIAGGYARDLPPMPSPGLAALAATQLNVLTPFNRQLKPDEQAENIESFLWEFWEVVVKLSQAYDEFGIGDEAQTCIVEILAELKKIEAQEVRARADPSIPSADGSCKITQLPAEVAQNILENITERAVLLNLMVTCKHLEAPAEAVLWESCNAGGYAKLLSLATNKQHYYKSKVRSLSLDFQINGLQSGDPRIFPLGLLTLYIRGSLSSTSDVPVHVSNFITSKMIVIDIFDGTTNNFLPALRRASNLKKLCIGDKVKVEGCDPVQFLHLVQSLPSLAWLDAGPVSSTELFSEVASLASLRKFYLISPVTLPIVVKSLRVPQSFRQLESLYVDMQASAASLLLPCLPQLRKLILRVTSVLSVGEDYTTTVLEVIKTIGTKQELRSLSLAVRDIRIAIDNENFAPLKNLIQLEHLALAHVFLVQYRATDDLHRRYRQFECVCKQSSNASGLSLWGALNVSCMSAQFSSLEELEVRSTDMPLMQSDADTIIHTLATKLVSVAPKLKRFRSGPIGAATTEIRFDHRQNSIFCTCRHRWNDDVTFTI